MEKIVSIPQAAKRCGIHRATMWKYVKAGKLKAFKTPGGQFRIHMDDLHAFMLLNGVYPFPTDLSPAKKILIVDDSLLVRKLLGRVFSRHDFELEYASDGFEAGIKALKFKPDLIILDLFMPNIDGFKLCEQLKNEDATAGIKIIAISGYDSQKNRHRIFECGADCFLPKPLDRKELLLTVQHLLNETIKTE